MKIYANLISYEYPMIKKVLRILYIRKIYSKMHYFVLHTIWLYHSILKEKLFRLEKDFPVPPKFKAYRPSSGKQRKLSLLSSPSRNKQNRGMSSRIHWNYIRAYVALLGCWKWRIYAIVYPRRSRVRIALRLIWRIV